MSNLHGSATRRVVLESSFFYSASHWIRAEAILNAELCYSQDITNHHFVIFKAPPTLIAHATTLKVCKFPFDQSNAVSRKKQCSVSLACSTLQCTRGTETNITQTIGIITAYVQSAWQGSNKSCAWIYFFVALPNGFAQKVLIARYPIPYLCHLFWFRPLYSRTPLDSKVCKFSLDQSNLDGKDQKNAVSCATFCSTLQCTRGTEIRVTETNTVE